MAGPPGIGKSFIAKTIQRTYGSTAIITNNNILVDQYCDTYPDLNAVKGKNFYDDVAQYRFAQQRAVFTPSVFNPLSFYYFHLRNPGVEKPKIVIIDEAHSLGQMLLLTVTKALSCEYFNIPLELDEAGIIDWLEQTTKKLEPFFQEGGNKTREKLGSQYEQLKLLYEYIKENLGTVKISYEDRETNNAVLKKYLIIQPLVLPVNLLKTIFGDARMILFSGSITNFHMQELFPNEDAIDFISYEPLAPVENRPIYYTPLPVDNRKDPKSIADEIRRLYLKKNKPNTMIHVSYQMAKQLGPLLKDLNVILHDKEDKQEALEQFRAKGGIILASGMAEGVDLPGDQCRLLIIPLLLYPNLGDSAVQKRMVLDDGNLWYALTTMMTTVQQLGRGVRSATDSCETYMLDSRFPNLITTTSKYLTQGLKDSIKWSI